MFRLRGTRNKNKNFRVRISFLPRSFHIDFRKWIWWEGLDTNIENIVACPGLPLAHHQAGDFGTKGNVGPWREGCVNVTLGLENVIEAAIGVRLAVRLGCSVHTLNCYSQIRFLNSFNTYMNARAHARTHVHTHTHTPPPPPAHKWTKKERKKKRNEKKSSDVLFWCLPPSAHNINSRRLASSFRDPVWWL